MRRDSAAVLAGWSADRKIRKLSDGEIIAVRRDCPKHLALSVGSWFHFAVVDKGESTLLQAANRFIEDYRLDETTQRIFWAGVERMFTFYPNESASSEQLPLL
jgi:hypothetical protein